MSRAIRLPFLVLLLPIGSGVACRAESDYRPPDCGTSALYLLMKAQGMTTGLGEVQSALPPPHELGFSLVELQSAAMRCGLNLAGERFGPDQAPLRSPAIAYRPGHKPASGHFVLIRPVGSHGTVVQVIDPPYAPRVIDYPSLFGGNGQPVVILRPSTPHRRWIPLALILMVAVLGWRLIRGCKGDIRGEAKG